MDSKYPNSNEFLLKEAEGSYFARDPKFVYVKGPHATDTNYRVSHIETWDSKWL